MTPTDLLKINVNDHTEKKNNLTYLSWAWAWAEVLKVDSNANYEVVQFQDPDNPHRMLPFQDIGGSHIVWVKVTVFGKALTVQLPILDYRNKPIPSPNAFEINTSIMRCLTKGIAMHGLGLYIYAGEDLPMDEPKPVPPAVTEDMINILIGRVKEAKTEAELKSLWMDSHDIISYLEEGLPEAYATVRNSFTEQKSKLTKEVENG